MDDRYKKYVECICGIAIVSFIIIKLIFKNLGLWDSLTYASTFTSIVVVLYATILWRINPFEKVPKLKKEYIGTLISTYDNTKRDVKIFVKQNLFETKIVFESNESSSKSITANFYDEYGTQMLSFGYINNPKAIYKDKNHLVGQYFTDRGTRGDIELQNILEKDNTIQKQLVNSKK